MIGLLDPTVIGAFITGIVSPVIIYVTQFFSKKAKDKKKDLIKESLETNVAIEHKIDNMLNYYKVDRIFVHQFHNGGYFYPTGKSIQKFSMVYETVNENVNSIQANFQNIPISLFSKVISDLSIHDKFFMVDYNDISLTNYYNMQSVRDLSASESSYWFAIRNIDSKFIGILGMDFCSHKRILTEEEISYIFSDVSTIGGVLDNLLKK